MVMFRLSSMERGLNNQQEKYYLDRPDDRRYRGEGEQGGAAA
jgi:hypothetical protein